MDKMNDLRDLLLHEIKDLYSVEEQIIEALPKMIEKSQSADLRQALENHLQETQNQKNRLDQVLQLMQEEKGKEEKCLGMAGIIRESEKSLGEEMEMEVVDALIVACAQKVEHYEICGYGTARAYARELNLGDVAELLEQTLNEEYAADDKLTDLAVQRLNEKAQGDNSGNGDFAMLRSSDRRMAAQKRNAPRKATAKKAASKKAASKKAASKKAGSKTASKASSKGASKTASKKGASTKGRTASKAASKSSSRNMMAGRKGASSKGSGARGGRFGASKGGNRRGR